MPHINYKKNAKTSIGPVWDESVFGLSLHQVTISKISTPVLCCSRLTVAYWWVFNYDFNSKPSLTSSIFSPSKSRFLDYSASYRQMDLNFSHNISCNCSEWLHKKKL